MIRHSFGLAYFMVELEYVKKRKRRRIVAIVSAVGFAGRTVLGIVSFLGRHTGTFTVSLDSGDVSLAIATKSSFEDKTSYLKIDDNLPTFQESSYLELRRNYGDSNIDDEGNDYLYGAVKDGETPVSLTFFKYTFFIRNTGTKTCRYDRDFNILSDTPYTDSEGNKISLADTRRVKIYDHSMDDETKDEHDGKIYAKRSATYNKKYGTFQEYITDDDKSLGVAERFSSADKICHYEQYAFLPGQTRRYTRLVWLEGGDPQSSNYVEPPKDATVKLGVDIKAYEDTQN